MTYESGDKWKGVAHPHMGLKDEEKPGPTTSVGKFRAALNAYKGNRHTKVPKEIRELYEFSLSKSTAELNELSEIKNLYKVLKSSATATMFEKFLSGEKPNKQDLELAKLLHTMMVDSHKLKYGDKKVIENVISVKDVRAAIYSEKPFYKKIVDAKVSEVKD